VIPNGRIFLPVSIAFAHRERPSDCTTLARRCPRLELLAPFRLGPDRAPPSPKSRKGGPVMHLARPVTLTRFALVFYCCWWCSSSSIAEPSRRPQESPRVRASPTAREAEPLVPWTSLASFSESFLNRYLPRTPSYFRLRRVGGKEGLN
jgi:hypothetical protein